MRIVVDAMGGDLGPHIVVEGIVQAIEEFDIDITLVGIEKEIQSELAKFNYPKNKVEIVHAPDVVAMDEEATVTLRKKKNSSISVGVQLLNDKRYDAFVSAGNTGAVVAASTIFLRMIPGVERPAIGLVIPTLKNFAFLIDVGANPEAKPQHLTQSAQMSLVYAREVLGVDSPRIGLLNIGEESSKGSGSNKEAHKMMNEKVQGFIGNVEANEIFSGRCDCIICDGFAGNILIKVSEGLMESAGTLIKREVKKSPLAMFGALLMKKKLGHIKKLADYSEYGGAPLLGVNGLVMIGHGRSSAKAIKNAIRATVKEIEHNILADMADEVLK